MTWYGECGYRTILNAVSHWLEGGEALAFIGDCAITAAFISLLVAAREAFVGR